MVKKHTWLLPLLIHIYMRVCLHIHIRRTRTHAQTFARAHFAFSKQTNRGCLSASEQSCHQRRRCEASPKANKKEAGDLARRVRAACSDAHSTDAPHARQGASQVKKSPPSTLDANLWRWVCGCRHSVVYSRLSLPKPSFKKNIYASVLHKALESAHLPPRSRVLPPLPRRWVQCSCSESSSNPLPASSTAVTTRRRGLLASLLMFRARAPVVHVAGIGEARRLTD